MQGNPQTKDVTINELFGGRPKFTKTRRKQLIKHNKTKHNV